MAQMTAFQAAVCGHHVTLYASADSKIVDYTAVIAEHLGLAVEVDDTGRSIRVQTSEGRTGSVTLQTTGRRAPGYRHPSCAELNQELVELLLADERKLAYDLIHNHHRRFTISTLIPAGLATKTMTHAHSPSLEGDYGQYRYPLICISNSQAKLLQQKHGANVFDFVYYGLDRFTYQATARSAGYLAWLGHFASKKAPDAAIRIAKKAGRPLVLAGTLREQGETAKRYYEEEVERFIDVFDDAFLDRIAGQAPEQINRELSSIAEKAGAAFPVIHAGPVNDEQKQILFGNAIATLFPVRWAEPFGRVMIESMACGTPVIGYARVGDLHCGAVEEVVEEGVTGFLVRTQDEDEAVMRAAQAVMKASDLNRNEVRRVFERDWSSERQARQLDESYKRFLSDPSQFVPRPKPKKHKRRWWKRFRKVLRRG